MALDIKLLTHNIQTVQTHHDTPGSVLGVRVYKEVKKGEMNSRNFFVIRPDLKILDPTSWLARLVFIVQKLLGQISTDKKLIDALQAKTKEDAQKPEYKKTRWNYDLPPTQSEEVQKLNLEIAGLQGERDAARDNAKSASEANTKMINDLVEAEKQAKEKGAKLDQAQKDLAAAQGEAKSAQESVARLEAELRTLQTKTAPDSTSTAAPASAIASDVSVPDLRRLIDELSKAKANASDAEIRANVLAETLAITKAASEAEQQRLTTEIKAKEEQSKSIVARTQELIRGTLTSITNSMVEVLPKNVHSPVFPEKELGTLAGFQRAFDSLKTALSELEQQKGNTTNAFKIITQDLLAALPPNLHPTFTWDESFDLRAQATVVVCKKILANIPTLEQKLQALQNQLDSTLPMNQRLLREINALNDDLNTWADALANALPGEVRPTFAPDAKGDTKLEAVVRVVVTELAKTKSEMQATVEGLLTTLPKHIPQPKFPEKATVGEKLAISAKACSDEIARLTVEVDELRPALYAALEQYDTTQAAAAPSVDASTGTEASSESGSTSGTPTPASGKKPLNLQAIIDNPGSPAFAKGMAQAILKFGQRTPGRGLFGLTEAPVPPAAKNLLREFNAAAHELSVAPGADAAKV